MYNNSSINITYYNGDLKVQLRNQSGINIGKVLPSCVGCITFGNKLEYFEFNEEKNEIVWTGRHAEDKWIRGCFC